MATKISGGTVHKIPSDLNRSLTKNSKALAAWESLTPLARNEWICWIEYVKKQETRDEHIVRAIKELTQGKKRPCCWYGCIHRTDKKISPSVLSVINRQKSKAK